MVLAIGLGALTAKPGFGQDGSRLSDKEAMGRAVYSPRPAYPTEARRLRVTGSGVVIVNVNSSGMVSSVRMRQSTGSPILDRAATEGFRQWKFKPGPPFSFWAPITFTMPGASYPDIALSSRPTSPRQDESEKPPFIGMTKAQVLARYGEPKKHTITDEGEQWTYLLNYGEVLGKAFIPFNFKPTPIRTGVLVFGPDGRVKKFNWDVPTDG